MTPKKYLNVYKRNMYDKKNYTFFNIILHYISRYKYVKIFLDIIVAKLTNSKKYNNNNNYTNLK